MSKIHSLTCQSKTPKKLVTPSSRDSIASWLDVLTSMLSLSETQREQVRDELEDHIRSRVDDLLITGTPEPEAIRTAVAELGETAELAKLISHAHTRTNPRRRIMNIALITAAIAGLSVGGISLNSGGAGQVMPSSHGTALVIDTDRSATDDQAQSFEMARSSMDDVLNEIAIKFDRELELSQDARAGDLSRQYYSLNLNSFAGDYTFKGVIAAFKNSFSEDVYGYELTTTDTTIRIESYDEYQRGTIETQVHAGPTWMNSNEIALYAISLGNLLSVKHDLQFASIEVIGGVIVVAAPQNIQTEVIKMMNELEASVMRRLEQKEAKEERIRNAQLLFQAERAQKVQEESARSAAMFEQTVKSLQDELDSARSKFLASKAQIRLIEAEFSTAKPGQDAAQRDAQLLSLESAYDEAQLQLAENEDRYTYLRSRMLDSQYAQLFSGLE